MTVFTGIKAADTGRNDHVHAGLRRWERAADNSRRRVRHRRRLRRGVPPPKAADQVVVALGESREQSGEAAARSEHRPARQAGGAAQAIKATGKPFVVVLFNGRPLTLGDVVDDAPAILESWFAGVQAGNAIADVLFGDVNPGGKLPVSFPRSVGQVPIYYNHEQHGPPVRHDAEVRLALPRHPELRPAVRVRVRAQLQQVRGREPAPELVDDDARTGACGRPSTSRTPARRRATTSSSSTSTTRSRAWPSRSAACAGSSA